MTMDSGFSLDTLHTDIATDSAPAPVAPKKRGRPATVKPPAMGLFTGFDASRFGIVSDTESGFDVLLWNTDGTMRVTYSGPSTRTEIAKLRQRRYVLGEIETADLAGELDASRAFQPQSRSVVLDVDVLVSALDYLAPAMSTDATRYNLNGIHVNGTRWEATDCHRLHVVRDMPEIPHSSQCACCTSHLILPAEFVKMMSKAISATKADRVTLTTDSAGGVRHVGFVAASASLSVEVRMRCHDAQFPHCDNVIPAVDPVPFVGDAEQIRGALKSAPVIGDRHVARELSFVEGECVTRRHDKVAINVPMFREGDRHDMPPVKANYQDKYLDAAFATLDGYVTVSPGGELSPLRIDNGTRTAIVMPLRA